MIDPVSGASPETPRPVRPERSTPRSPARAADPRPRPAPPPPQFGRRIEPIARRIESLLEELSAIRGDDGPDHARRTRIEREISTARVRLQNLLSTEPPALPGLPTALQAAGIGAHALNPNTILKLLE